MKINLLVFSLLIPLGIFIIVLGGMDDSPGLQGIGLITIIISVFKILRIKHLL